MKHWDVAGMDLNDFFIFPVILSAMMTMNEKEKERTLF